MFNIDEISGIVNVNEKYEFILDLIKEQDRIDNVNEIDYGNLAPILIIDGMDGSGKGTYKKLILDYLTLKGYNLVSVKEPSDYLRKEILSSINNLYDPWITAALFILDRKHQFNMLSKEKFGEKTILFFDRSYLSTLAYQSVQGIDFDLLEKLHYFVPKSELSLIFVCDVLDAQKRILERYEKEEKEIDEFEKLDFIVKIKRKFEEIVNLIENGYLIDTSGDVKDIPKIFERIKAILDERINF